MNVEDLVKKIELRPGMYVGAPSLEAIFYFISGYHPGRTKGIDEVNG